MAGQKSLKKLEIISESTYIKSNGSLYVCSLSFFKRLNGWTDWAETQHINCPYTPMCTCKILAFRYELFGRKYQKSNLVKNICTIFESANSLTFSVIVTKFGLLIPWLAFKSFVGNSLTDFDYKRKELS